MTMQRRAFLRWAGALALAPLATARTGYAAGPPPLRFADMHAHLWFKQGHRMRAIMIENGMLVVGEDMVPDSGYTRWSSSRQTREAFRDPGPGDLRRNFDRQFERALARVAAQDLVTVDSVAALERVEREKIPGIVLSSEGADFLEGDLAYMDNVRRRGLVHLQLVHYRISDVGDISTEDPKHGGLTAFGKDVVRSSNRLGMLVDVAHCTSAGIAQVLELSNRPVVYSHGHVSPVMPTTWRGGAAARAIHLPLAKALAEKGGVVGLWPLWVAYPNLDLYADELMRMVDALGAAHVGVGTDMDGLGRSTIPGYEEFAALPDHLARRGLNSAGIEGVLGANYLRVLRQALTV